MLRRKYPHPLVVRGDFMGTSPFRKEKSDVDEGKYLISTIIEDYWAYILP